MSDRIVKLLRFVSSVILFSTCSSPVIAGDPDRNTEFKNLLMNEYYSHPEAAAQDFYKFMFQASMGPGHWKMDFRMAKEYLDAEVKTLKQNTPQPLYQYLTPDSELVRVYLQPYISMQGNIDSLAEAFVKTTNEFVPSEKTLENYITLFLQTVKENTIAIPVDSALVFMRQMKNEHYPSVHHSQLYEEKYLPAYRVVFRKYLPLNIDHAPRKN